MTFDRDVFDQSNLQLDLLDIDKDANNVRLTLIDRILRVPWASGDF